MQLGLCMWVLTVSRVLCQSNGHVSQLVLPCPGGEAFKLLSPDLDHILGDERKKKPKFTFSTSFLILYQEKRRWGCRNPNRKSRRNQRTCQALTARKSRCQTFLTYLKTKRTPLSGQPLKCGFSSCSASQAHLSRLINTHLHRSS